MLPFLVTNVSWWSFHFMMYRHSLFFTTTGEYSKVSGCSPIYIQRLRLSPVLKIFPPTLQDTFVCISLVPMLVGLLNGSLEGGSAGHRVSLLLLLSVILLQHHLLFSYFLPPGITYKGLTWEMVTEISVRITWSLWEGGKVSTCGFCEKVQPLVLQAAPKLIQFLREAAFETNNLVR